MKTTIQHKLAAAIIAMLPAALSAQEHIEADIGADIVSGYIWRGQDLGNISIQPPLPSATKEYGYQDGER